MARRRKARVADYCVVCRAIRPFAAAFELGQGVTLDLVSSSCGWSRSAQPDKFDRSTPEGIVDERRRHGIPLAERPLVYVGLITAVVAALVVIAVFRPRDDGETVFTTVAVTIVGFLAAAIYVGVTNARGFVRREIEPLAARALAPLKPSAEELREVLPPLAASGRRVARHLDVARLPARIPSIPAEH